MDEQSLLAEFFRAIERDARVSLTHIGVYAAVLHFWRLAGKADPFLAYSYEVMKLAKVSSRTTYFKAIGELNEYGYLRYEPSFKCRVPSKISLQVKEENDECGDCNKGRFAGVSNAANQ